MVAPDFRVSLDLEEEEVERAEEGEETEGVTRAMGIAAELSFWVQSGTESVPPRSEPIFSRMELLTRAEDRLVP